MKKHRHLGSLRLSKGLPIILFLLIFLFSCKTIPTGTVVKAPDLLNNKKNFYISIPSSADPELIKFIIKSNIQNVSDSDVEEIVSRIDRAYAGLNADNKNPKLQLAIDSDIPIKYIPKILTKKNGWEVKEYTGPTSGTKYGIFTQEEIVMAFPSDKLTLIGEDVEGMINQYDQIHAIPAEESLGKSFENLDELTYGWITESSSDIRFITNKPETFLLMLTGQKLTLQLNTVRGTFICDPKNDNQYILDFIFEFRNETAAKAGKVMLGFAFGLADGSDNSLKPNEVKIEGIKLSKKQLYDILSL
ncbi:MAG: hypothetical protein K5907_02745 [Treponema sp.]|nr:hypothetical protein [Treponema sp.]